MKEFLEMIKSIRTEPADFASATKYARYFGFGCLVAALWNFLCLVLVFPGNFPVDLDSTENRTAIGLVAFAGLIAFGASLKLGERSQGGVLLAKASLLSCLAGVAVFLVGLWTAEGMGKLMPPGGFGIFFRIFMVLVFAQFFVPLGFAFGYLNRLELVSESSLFTRGREIEAESVEVEAEGRFREGVFPFGVQATFIVSLLAIMAPVMVVQKFLGMEWMHMVFVPVFLVVFLGPLVWNETTSSFERTRQVLFKHRVGISLFFFNATGPFCRILVYRDGVEVRVMLNRYFLPYDRFTSPPAIEGFFSKSLVLRSRLPDVPYVIRIRSGKAGEILEEMEKAQAGSRS